MRDLTIYRDDDGSIFAKTPEGEAFRFMPQSEARRLGLARYFFGNRCKNGSYSERITSSAACTCDACRADARKATEHYDRANREKILAKRSDFRAANRGKIRDQQKRYYYEKNKGASQSARRCSRLNATPTWASKADIFAVYAEAARLTEETGILHHVDHIVPLQNPHVCGLHVPWNLRPIPANDNLSKNNRLQNCDLVTYFDECLKG